MTSFPRSVADICHMIKIEHSVFALPYAWAGAFLAARALPSLAILFGLTIAMVAVRSFAMTFNRIADLKYDRENPRTKNRPLVTGAITLKEAWIFAIVMAMLFIGACALLNTTCLLLSVPALAFAGGYSYLKRFSPLSHFWLGATLGLAPIAGWLAVQPTRLDLAPILLFFAVTFWVGAFDIYYAFQDMEWDRTNGLHSVPADLDGKGAMLLAAFSHILTVIFLLLTGLAASLGWPWYVLVCGTAVLLLTEHRIITPEDLTHVNTAFFTLNGIISPLILAGVILGIYI